MVISFIRLNIWILQLYIMYSYRTRRLTYRILTLLNFFHFKKFIIFKAMMHESQQNLCTYKPI